MLHQPQTSLSPHYVLLSLPQPSLANSLFSNPSAEAGSTTDSMNVPSNYQNSIIYQAVETSKGTSDVHSPFFNPWRDVCLRQIDRTKIPERCEVCKVDFTSQKVFEDHIYGKKHKKKMQLHNNPSNTILSGTSNVNVQVQDSSVQGQEPFVDEGKDLKSKKRKLLSMGEAEHNDQVDLTSDNDGIGSKKAKVTQYTRCEICMINCNTKDVYITHLSGKKHLRNLKKLSQSESDGAGACADFSVAGIAATIVTENDKQPTPNPTVIESHEKLGIKQQESENAALSGAPGKDTETKKQSKSNDDPGADASMAGMTAAIATENDKQPASTTASESQQRPSTNEQERVNSCQPENAIISEAPEKDTETKKRKLELEDGTSITSTKFCTPSNVNHETFFDSPDCPARCEICMVNCNSKSAYIEHISGKRHKRNLQKVSKSKQDAAGTSADDLVAAIVTEADMQQATNQAIEAQEKPGSNEQDCINSYQPGKDTETKEQFESKIDVANAGVDVSVAGTNAAIVTENDQQPALNSAAIEPQGKPGTNKQDCIDSRQAVILVAPEKDTETRKRKLELEGETSIASTKSCTLSYVNNETVFNLLHCPAWCEVCMINCSRKLDYIIHILGKRHKRNLEKVSKSKNDGAGASVADAAIMHAIDARQATNQAIKSQEKLETSPQERVDNLKSGSAVMLEAPEKDMETKRRKIEPFDGAATATFRVCKLCNAPCNSEAAFNSHLHGKKHAAMVKKSKGSWGF